MDVPLSSMFLSLFLSPSLYNQFFLKKKKNGYDGEFDVTIAHLHFLQSEEMKSSGPSSDQPQEHLWAPESAT